MKLIKLLPITILALVMTATVVSATHTPQVLLNPSEWAADTSNDIYLSVTNSGPDAITKVDLIIPEEYKVTEIGEPSGWKYETRTDINTNEIYKIIWTATGSGMQTGESTDFGLTAVSPSSGEYTWSWTTTDVNGGTFPGTSTTRIAKAGLAYFRIDGVPSEVTAGSSFKITIRAYGSDGAIKTDYKGTVTFTPSDIKALLPSSYTFTSADMGVKELTVTYKTAGEQTIAVTDWSSKVTQTSAATNVKAGSATSINVLPENAEVNPMNSVSYQALAKDKYDNQFDVTGSTSWNIDSEAGGSWAANVYTAEEKGIWTVTGTYISLTDGTNLIVKEGSVVTPPVEEPEEVPEETPEEEPEQVPEEVPEEPAAEFSIDAESPITITPGTNETFIVTVNNMGTTDLTNVVLSVMNYDSDLVTVYPSKITIAAGTSRDYLMVVSVPENYTEAISMDIIASSNEGTTASTIVEINPAEESTGLMGLSKNLLNLGIVIVAVAALVLIAWELWFRKPK